MAIRRRFIGLAIVGILGIGIWVLGSVSQATAETLKFKSFNHVTKQEEVPVADVEGHAISLTVREGVAVFENGEWAWHKSAYLRNYVKGAGTSESYGTYTFLDGSSIIVHGKGTIEATPAGVPSSAKWTVEVIHGTGRFQGIKGTTTTTSTKLLPPEKDEPVGKALSEGTLVYTLPSK
jgi:hypothetical protein